jgi:hypothetical protein
MAKKPAKTVESTAAEAAAAAATAAVAAASESSKENTEVKTRGPRGVSESALITLLVVGNPKRDGSKAHARFAFYSNGMTVGAALDAGVTTPDLGYDTKHGFISIEGYDAGEIIVAKPKAEKAEKAPKTAKGGKVKAEKTEADVAAEQDVAAATTEESMD